MAIYEFDIFRHKVYQPEIIPKSHQAPPADSITLELTIHATLVTIHHNCMANLYSITNTPHEISLDFDFGILENESLLNQTLAPYLDAIGINIWSVNYDNLIREIMERGLRMSGRVVKRGGKRMVLPLRSLVLAGHVEHDCDDPIFMRRVLEESEAELERTNYGMVAAKGSSIEELKNVRVEEETDCMVCLDDIEVGRYASQMPCSHIFHAYCIKKWLEQSHYCPICRYEMPTNDEVEA